MSLAELIGLMPPPDAPVFCPDASDWAQAEERLNTSLPSDYKAFVSLYGAGFIGGEICFLNPLLPDRSSFNLFEWVDFLLKSLKEVRQEFPSHEDYGFALYPEINGLLPCGLTCNSHTLFWKTTGLPDEWTISIMEARSPEHEEYAMGLIEFVEMLLRGNIKSDMFTTPPFDPRIAFKRFL